MSWRPEGWEHKGLHSSLPYTHPHLEGEAWKIFEAGADAILEALRTLKDRDDDALSRRYRGVFGTWVCIPDDEVKDEDIIQIRETLDAAPMPLEKRKYVDEDGVHEGQ